MRYLRHLFFLLSLVTFFPLATQAASYTLVSGSSCGSGSVCPVCSGGAWSVSGANFTCSSSITFASGDTVTISNSGSITANAMIALNNNTIGSATRTINLISNSNTITTTGNSSVFGSITANSSTISLTGGSVTGSVNSGCCSITTNGTIIGGAITSTSGTVSITGGSVGGAVTSGCCAITANNTVISGSISANNAITLTNSTIGSSSSPVSVTSSNGSVTLNTATNAYGTLTAPSWSTVYVNSGSTVSGTCIPNSTPANACNSSPVLLGAWRMDELSWNGTAAEVKDSSGSGNHGKASVAVVGSVRPSTTSGTFAYATGGQSTCRYGAFDGTGSPARTNTYVELSGFPALPNGFTFAAWIRSTNASAQHQRILVRDDADNGWGLSLADGTGSPALRFFNRNVTNNGAVIGQGVNPNCGVFCVDTNPVIASNTWYYVAAAVDTTAKTVTLYVYNQAGALNAKAVGAYSGNWVDGTGTVAIGGETVNSAEGRQTSFHFLGNIDEVNIYSGALSQASIESLLPSVRTCPAPDHYELVMSANNLTCLGADVTVRACADSISPCNNIDYTVNSNVTLNTDAGSLNSTTLSLVSGSGTAKLLYPAAANNAVAKVTLSGEATVATNARKCCLGGTCTVSNSCTTTFNTAGLIFPDSATGTSNNIANQTAGVTSPTSPTGTAYVRALQTNATTGACMARFTSPQTVKMAYKCVNPITCINGETLTLNGAGVQANANSVNANALVYSDVNVNFDVNGSGSIPINYTDVGQIQLSAQIIKDQTPTDPAITLRGDSNLIVVKPYDLVVTSVTTASNGANPQTTTSGSGFAPAGASFKVGVQSRAYTASGARVTPNFGNETAPENIGLIINSLISPASGNSGALTNPNAFLKSGSTFNNTTVSWDEVGTLGLKAHIADGNYLGAGDVASVATTTVGRFYPDHFALQTGTTSNGCGGFTYLSQPTMSLSYELRAKNTAGNVVTNYRPGFTNALAEPDYSLENLNDGVNLGNRFASLTAAPVWASGVLSFATSTASLARATSGIKVLRDGPFESAVFGLGVKSDLDSRLLLASQRNTNPAAIGDCALANNCSAAALGLPLKFRFGRLRLDDAFGPETHPLKVNFVTEYWTGNYFSLNADDSCTQVLRSAITYPNGVLTADGNRTVNLAGGSTTGIYGVGNINFKGTYVEFKAGTAGQEFTSPNGGIGRFVVGVNLTNLPWLRFDWNQDGDFSDVSLPSATFEFGSYRGNDRVIYWRERLQ